MRRRVCLTVKFANGIKIGTELNAVISSIINRIYVGKVLACWFLMSNVLSFRMFSETNDAKKMISHRKRVSMPFFYTSDIAMSYLEW